MYTVLFVLSPGSTSSSVQPSLPRMAEAMASMTSVLRPSEKLGTHSTTLSDDALKGFLFEDDILATILERLRRFGRDVHFVEKLGRSVSLASYTMSVELDHGYRDYVDDHYQFPCKNTSIDRMVQIFESEKKVSKFMNECECLQMAPLRSKSLRFQVRTDLCPVLSCLLQLS